MEYIQSKLVSLKKSPDHSEKWLQEVIANAPEVLGLGEITLRETERRQLNGGRLDLMFDDEAGKVRYTVELQLGASDEAHIIRTIEYWDNERSRNPHIDHIAVIVAEDITTRFLNVISLFNKSIPLIAIQLSAIQVGDAITLNCVKVLDISTNMGWEEDNTAAVATDRSYWLKKATPQTVALADDVLSIVHEVLDSKAFELNYNKHYVGLASGGVANNTMIIFRPRKQNLLLQIKIPRSDEVTELIEQYLDLVSYDTRWGQYQVRVTAEDLKKHRSVLKELIRRAARVSDDDGIDE
jgi:hypothetical protein